MSGGFGMPYGLQSMLKDGHKHFSGIEEAVMKNIEACKTMSQITRTSMGPNGMNKMVINHLERLFVTSDASTIVTELDVHHPAAKLLVMAAKAQEQEIGDGTNLVLTLAGELLGNAESLLRDGLHPTEIADGYQAGCKKALEILDGLVLPKSEVIDVKNNAEVSLRLRGTISSKQNGCEHILCPLVAIACIDVCPKNPVNFNVDNVRVVKITGGALGDSTVIKGMVFKRDTEGTLKNVENAKVACYTQAVDTAATDTKGTVLIKTAEELENYSRTEEDQLETYIKSIADTGTQVIVSGGNFGEMAMHFIEKYKMLAIRIPSKFELRRFCQATNTTARSALGAPSPEELGFVKSLTVEEIGGTNCIVLRQDASVGSIATIVIRGSTDAYLDDVERAINDAINSYKALCKDSRMIPGGGATEIEVARQVGEFGRKTTGLEQYSIIKYADAFEVVPRTLAENCGVNSSDAISSLYAAHAAGNVNVGLDIETGSARDLSVGDEAFADLYLTKWWAVKLATDAVITVLKVDQIIMAKQAGGPKPRSAAGDED